MACHFPSPGELATSPSPNDDAASAPRQFVQASDVATPVTSVQYAHTSVHDAQDTDEADMGGRVDTAGVPARGRESGGSPATSSASAFCSVCEFLQGRDIPHRLEVLRRRYRELRLGRHREGNMVADTRQAIVDHEHALTALQPGGRCDRAPMSTLDNEESELAVADAHDEDDAPIPLVPVPEVAHAPEVAGTARHLLDPAKAAAVEWRELDRHLVQLTVEQRREVLMVVRRMRGVA